MKFPIFGASNDDMGTAATYAFISSTFAIDWTTTENRRQIPLSEDVTISDFKVLLDSAPGVGNSRTFTIRQNGADTGVTVTISDANTEATFSGSVSFTQGDLIGLQATAGGTPGSSGIAYWHMFMNTTGQKALLMGGSTNVAPNGAINYVDVFGGTAWTTTSAAQDAIVSTGGNVTKLYVASHLAAGAAKSYDFSMRLNNSSDVLTATISGGTSKAANASGSQALSAGDTIQFKSSPTGTPTLIAVGWCFTFEPTTNGESIFGFGTSTNLSTSATQFEQPLGAGAGYSVSEAGRLLKLPAISFKNLYVRISAAAGALSSRTITLRDNASNSALTTTLSDPATTNSDTTHTVVHTADQSISIQSTVPVPNPTTANLHLGMTIVTTQPATASSSLSLLGVG